VKTQKRSTGDVGEEIVCRYLERNGFIIADRNYLRPWGEIDIVAKKLNFISFIEVKTVSKEGIRPEENMHPAKIKRLHRVIQTYLLEKKIPESTDWRIDLACVFLDFSTRRAKVEVLENIIL
jgi:putative endonuclease